jgi:hypothetical protein
MYITDPPNILETVNPSISGLPPGAQAIFTPPQPQTYQDVTVTITTSASQTPPGRYEVTIGGTVVETDFPVTPFTFTLVMQARVKLKPDEKTKSIITGEAATFAVRVLRSGYAGAIKLDSMLLESPSNAAVIKGFDPDGFTTAETVNFRVKVAATGQGRYRFRLTPTLPTAMPDVALVPVDVTVKARGVPALSLSLSPRDFNVQSEESFALTATVTRFNDCQGKLNFFASVDPVTAFGAINFQPDPDPDSPDTFRATIKASPVRSVTRVTITVSVSAVGCGGTSKMISGTVRPRFFVPFPIDL